MPQQYNGAEAFVEALNAQGIDHIFFNPGGEMAAIQATIARYQATGKPAPELILCLDESVAMTAAHGHYMISGVPQLVMVHCELGTQQIGGTLHNAQWGRAPIVIWAGAEPTDARVNWRQEPFDQGSLVRNCVKWDHQISAEEKIPAVLQQAFQIALTEPRGPVYLYYPREMLLAETDRINIAPASDSTSPSHHEPEVARLGEIADILITADNPLIMVGATGRYQQSVATLVELAETLCAPVLTGPVWMNFPSTHPLYAGTEQILGSRKANPYVEEADVILLIDYDRPYATVPGAPRAEAKIVHIDNDPFTQGRYPWDRQADIYLDADSREAIPLLNKLINEKLTPERCQALRQRYSQLENAHRKLQSSYYTLAINKGKQRPISPDWLCACLAQLIDEETIVVHHTISHSASITEQISRTRPGTILSCAGGSIQWALATALGAKVAAPDKLVVSLMTDGGFVWGCPVATLWTAGAYRAPFLSIIFDNQSYGFIKAVVRQIYGEANFSDDTAFSAGVDFVPPPDYAKVAEACGAYGRLVEDPDDLMPALKEAIEQVRQGRAAVLDVRLERTSESLMPAGKMR